MRFQQGDKITHRYTPWLIGTVIGVDPDQSRFTITWDPKDPIFLRQVISEEQSDGYYLVEEPTDWSEWLELE